MVTDSAPEDGVMIRLGADTTEDGQEYLRIEIGEQAAYGLDLDSAIEMQHLLTDVLAEMIEHAAQQDEDGSP